MARLLTLGSVVAALSGVAQASPTTLAVAPKYIFSFGDSYTATWFNASSTLPNKENPFGNPPYPGYTACGFVTNWVDVLTAKYNTSLVYTYNYAYGGAVIDRDLVTPYQPDVQTFEDQVALFLATAASKPPATPWNSKESLFSIFIGINDMGNSWWLPGSDAFADTLLNAYFALVEKLYVAGGRNFLFLNVPSIDRTPAMLAQSPEAREGERVVINAFNAKLASRVAAFKASHWGTKTWVYDANTRLVSILNNPTQYGLQDATSYGPGDTVAWCNDYHISPPVHEVYGKEVAKLLKAPGGFF